MPGTEPQDELLTGSRLKRPPLDRWRAQGRSRELRWGAADRIRAGNDRPAKWIKRIRIRSYIMTRRSPIFRYARPPPVALHFLRFPGGHTQHTRSDALLCQFDGRRIAFRIGDVGVVMPACFIVRCPKRNKKRNLFVAGPASPKETLPPRPRWAEALAEELLVRQRDDGSWANPVDSFREDDPLVATSFAVRALAGCR
jgi:hypothetical protein